MVIEMIGERESRILEDIEEEISRLVRSSEEVEEKVSRMLTGTIKVRYCSLMRDYSEIIEAIRKGEVVITSLSSLEDSIIKVAISEVKEEVEKNLGKMYFINRPV
ncbi:MAG: hypothetical protein QW655_04910, partial [Nitrososphaerota archaeon]